MALGQIGALGDGITSGPSPQTAPMQLGKPQVGVEGVQPPGHLGLGPNAMSGIQDGPLSRLHGGKNPSSRLGALGQLGRFGLNLLGHPGHAPHPDLGVRHRPVPPWPVL